MLLGCGQAGKSTFIKQMRIIHSEGFQDDEKEQIKLDIASNIAHSITCLIENSVFDETLETDENKKLQAAIDNITSTFDKHFDINTQRMRLLQCSSNVRSYLHTVMEKRIY